MKVYTVNLESEEVDGPVTVRVNAGETVGEFKQMLARMFDMDADTMKVGSIVDSTLSVCS